MILETTDHSQSCTTSPNKSHHIVQFSSLVLEFLLVFFRQMILKSPGAVVEREVGEDFIVTVLDEERWQIGIAMIHFMDGQIIIVPMVIPVAQVMEGTQMDVEVMALGVRKAEAVTEEVEVEALISRPNHPIPSQTMVDTEVGLKAMDQLPLTADMVLVQHLQEVLRLHATSACMEEMMIMVGMGQGMEAMAIFRVVSAEKRIVKQADLVDMAVIKDMGNLEERVGPMVREEVGGDGVGIINLLLFIAVICNNHFSYIYVYYMLGARDR